MGLDNTPDTYIKQLTRKDLLAKARTVKQMDAQFINHYDLGELRSGDLSATDYWIINNLTYWFRGDPIDAGLLHRAGFARLLPGGRPGEDPRDGQRGQPGRGAQERRALGGRQLGEHALLVALDLVLHLPPDAACPPG